MKDERNVQNLNYPAATLLRWLLVRVLTTLPTGEILEESESGAIWGTLRCKCSSGLFSLYSRQTT